jgi:PPP family 3-phenylpropionic acid transporter
MIGLLWAVGVIAEVALFAAGATAIERIGPVRLLVVAGIAGIVRWTAAGLTADLRLLVLVQLLHGLTFAAAHLAAVYFLMRAVPAALAATAQGLYGAVAWGAAFGLTMSVAGLLYAAYGGGAFFVMAGMCLVGTLAVLSLLRGEH